jgi:hypothetical protein
MLVKYFLSSVVVGVSLLGLSAGAPTGTSDLVRRACTTALPSYVGWIDSEYPNESFNHSTVGNVQEFRLNHGSTIFGTAERKSLIRFDIPRGSTGCMLSLAFPPQFVVAGGESQADVYGIEGNAGPQFTWNNPPVTTTKWATTTWPDTPGPAFSTILQSNTCSTQVSFFFQLSPWQTGSGFVDFINQQSIGFSMIYDC